MRSLIFPFTDAQSFSVDNLLLAKGILKGVQKALTQNQLNRYDLERITLVHNQKDAIDDAIKAASEIFKQPNFLAQKVLNDLAQGEDLLNIKVEIDALAEVLLLRDLEPPIAVGILGGWGSGKSFIMHLIQTKINEIRGEKIAPQQAWQDTEKSVQQYPFVGHIYQIKFDAWTYARANLWASLMQTIFCEINRQITLEKQLEKAGVSAVEGGSIWRVLNEMNNDEREAILNSELTISAEKWEDISGSNDVVNSLLKSIEKIKEKEINELQKTEQKLKKNEEELQKELIIIENEVDRKIKIQSEAAVWQPLAERIESSISQSLVKAINQQFNTSDSKSSVEIGEIDAEKVKMILQEIQQNNWSYWWRFLLKNKITVIAFLVFFIFVISLPFWLDSITSFFVKILGLIPVISGVPIIQILWSKWNQWKKETIRIIRKYKSQVEVARQKLENQRQKEIEQKSQTPKISGLKNQVTQLKVKAKKQRQQIGLPIKYTSITDIVSNKLQEGYYQQKLGLMQQVQTDLLDLTNALIITEKEKANKFIEQKREQLEQLFPRGQARIILYIDDLDRCPPKRVVEVLEAVQLLLKTSLFVVVLAIDERYISRALEKVYDQVLIKRGRPSGTDYIEKIIQIPYRVRPIAKTALEKYLDAQMDYERETQSTENQENLEKMPSVTGKQGPDKKSISSPFGDDKKKEETSAQSGQSEVKSSTEISEAIKFSQRDFNIVLKCCQEVDLSPRTVKRIINVYKIFKIVWYRLNRRQPEQANENIIQGIVSLLVLSGRYPDLMRSVFEELETQFEQSTNAELDEKKFKDFFIPKISERDVYMKREWDRLLHDVALIPADLTLAQMGQDTFNMVRSFCFVGDIGYDPDDLTSGRVETMKNW